MASLAQIRANQQNAQASTGPRTAEGKARSRLNAMKHGLLAERVVLVHDGKPEEFFALYYELHRDLDPVGRLEEVLVDRVVGLVWRLDRATLIERQVLKLGVSKCKGLGVELGRAFLEDALGPEALSKLSRYETALHTRLFKTLHELERIQARRQDRASTAPPVVELDASVTISP